MAISDLTGLIHWMQKVERHMLEEEAQKVAAPSSPAEPPPSAEEARPPEVPSLSKAWNDWVRWVERKVAALEKAGLRSPADTSQSGYCPNCGKWTPVRVVTEPTRPPMTSPPPTEGDSSSLAPHGRDSS